jgi:hypothetical protein
VREIKQGRRVGEKETHRRYSLEFQWEGERGRERERRTQTEIDMYVRDLLLKVLSLTLFLTRVM